MRCARYVLLPVLALLSSASAIFGSENEVLTFVEAGHGVFTFDTGKLRGRLHADGRSLGLTEVVHVPTGARLDRSNGLLSHYRVFTHGRRYGAGAWDWPSVARLNPSNTVEVVWADAPDRSFGIRALYRFVDAATIQVETAVQSRGTLRGFEVFLASYFDSAFTNALIRLDAPGSTYAEATEDRGVWQMYPRHPARRSLIEDGRWQLEPHPVAWVFPATWSGQEALALRRSASRRLVAALRAPAQGCFAIATPHQTEGHYSTYLSLFGENLRPGELARAVVELSIRPETEAKPQ